MDRILKPEAYWDSVAGKKEFTLPFDSDAFTNHVEKTDKILEIGCGYGRILNHLHLFGFKHLTGLDIAQQMIERGLKLYPQLNLQKHDGGPLPCPADTYHAAILVAVLTCIPESKKQHELLLEIERVLKPGGILYIHDFLLNRDKRNIDRYNQCRPTGLDYGSFEHAEGVVLRHHTREHILELTRRFNTQLFRCDVYKTMNKNQSNGFCYIGKKAPAPHL